MKEIFDKIKTKKQTRLLLKVRAGAKQSSVDGWFVIGDKEYLKLFIMDMSVSFLLQATRVLHVDNYDDDELTMIYNFVINLDNDILNDYNNTCTILSYDNDLELYIEIVDSLIMIFEEKEEYEKCELLLFKREESVEIINSKTI